MKHTTGFILFIIGCGGLSEAYGKPTQILISIILATLGGLILFHEVKDEKVHIDKRTGSDNILDRLRYLP